MALASCSGAVDLILCLCLHRNCIQGGCYLAHDLLGLVVAVTDCRGAFACFWSTEVARGVAGGGAGGCHRIQWRGGGLEESCCTSEAVDDASVSQRSGFGRIFYSAGAPDRGMFCGLLRGWRRGRARGGPGGRNGGKGARFPKKVKKHTNKKSLPTSRIRPPWERKADRLFSLANMSLSLYRYML